MSVDTRRLTSLGLAFLLVGSAALVVLAIVKRAAAEDLNAPVAVARAEAVNFFALDYRSPERSVDRVLALATGTFADQYRAQRHRIQAGMVKQQLRVTASVPDGGSALVSVTGSSASVIVAVDVQTVSAAGTHDAQYRTAIGLVHHDGAWLVDDIEEVG